jgi:hypothetical protein
LSGNEAGWKAVVEPVTHSVEDTKAVLGTHERREVVVAFFFSDKSG